MKFGLSRFHNFAALFINTTVSATAQRLKCFQNYFRNLVFVIEDDKHYSPGCNESKANETPGNNDKKSSLQTTHKKSRLLLAFSERLKCAFSRGCAHFICLTPGYIVGRRWRLGNSY